MRPALVYLRVSTQRQADSGVGLEAQEARCRAHATRAGWTVAAVYADEGISGREGVAGRPGLLALLEHARQLPDAVAVVYSLSRLARTQRLLWTLLDGLALSSATEPFDTTTPSGRAMLGMLATFATLEADLASERTKDAMGAARTRGVRLGRPSLRDVVPEACALARELYAGGGFTHRTLADELNRRGVATAQGGRWHARTVSEALKVNP